MITDIANADSRWSETCTGFHSEGDCLRPTNENGYARCQWVPAPADYDCALLWPTPEPESGCCAGAYSSVCGPVTSQTACSSMASCHWIEGDDADCESGEESTTG